MSFGLSVQNKVTFTLYCSLLADNNRPENRTYLHLRQFITKNADYLNLQQAVIFCWWRVPGLDVDRCWPSGWWVMLEWLSKFIRIRQKWNFTLPDSSFHDQFLCGMQWFTAFTHGRKFLPEKLSQSFKLCYWVLPSLCNILNLFVYLLEAFTASSLRAHS